MREHGSVLWLMIQSTFGKILAVLAGTAVVQAFLFQRAVQQLKPGEYGLEQALTRGHTAGIAGLGFLAITVFLCLTGAERGREKTGYTLQRLSVSEKMVLLWQAIYNGSCYLLLWASQVVVVLALSHWYTQIADPAMVTSQTIFLAFYRHEYLHGLLPMAEMEHWIRNLMLLLGLGLSSAYFTYAQRRRRKNGQLLTMILLVLLFFRDHINSGGTEGLVIVVSIICIGKILWNLQREGEAHEA